MLQALDMYMYMVRGRVSFLPRDQCFSIFSKKHRKKKARHKSSSESEEESSEGKGVLTVWNVF